MARTQLRLDAVTGSLVSIEAAAKAAGVPAAGSAADLQDVLGHFAGAIKRITGAPSFTEQDAGQFSQALTGSAGMKLGGDLHVVMESHLAGDAKLDNKLTVSGAADFNGGVSANEIKIDGDTPGRMYIVGGNGEIKDTDKLTFDGTNFNVAGGVDASGTVAAAAVAIDGDVAGRLYIVDADGSMKDEANLTFADAKLSVAGGVDASGTVEASAMKIDGDTAQRLYIVDADGSMKDEAKLVFDGAKLAIDGNLEAVNGAFSGDVSVVGSLSVAGALTYIDTENLLVKDAKIVISSGSLVDGAGIYLGEETAGENIRWATADGGKWIASDKFAADELQALDLSEALVWADASGNLKEVTAAQFAGYLKEGFGIDSVADGQIDATPYVAGTGVTINAFTASIGQDVAPASSVEFAGLTLTGMANKLVWSNAGVLEAAELVNFVAGTEYEIAVADDEDGTITLSLALQLTDATYSALPEEYASVAEAINTLHANLGASSAEKAAYTLAADFASGEFVGQDAGLDAVMNSLKDNGGVELVYVNGQLLAAGADYTWDETAPSLEFAFGLKADDVVTIVKV